jgi:hypothetical protein
MGGAAAWVAPLDPPLCLIVHHRYTRVTAHAAAALQVSNALDVWMQRQSVAVV